MYELSNVTIHSNWLHVNNHALRANVLKNSKSEKLPVNAEQLDQILKLGRVTILQGIEDFYELTQKRNPGLTVERPSIFTAHFGTTAQTDGRNSRVLTEKGYDNGGIITAIDEIQEPFQAHWNAVKASGFVPEVRRTTTKDNAGSWLLLRKPTPDDVLRGWLDYTEPSDSQVIRERLKSGENDKQSTERDLRLYAAIGQKAIESQSLSIPDTHRQHIGLELAYGVLRVEAGNDTGFDDIYDARDYATNVLPAAGQAINNMLWRPGDS